MDQQSTIDQRPTQILLVEDSAGNSAGSLDLFQSWVNCWNTINWRLTQVESLSQAVGICQVRTVDLILLDAGLVCGNSLNGMTLMQTAIPDVPIVLLTPNEDSVYKAQLHGIQDCLPKHQLTPSYLVQTIRYVLERNQILRQLQDCERRFHGVFEQTFQFMILLTPLGIVQDLNQTLLAFTNSTEQEWIGQPIWQTPLWKTSPDSQSWLEVAVVAARRGESVREEIRVFGEDEQGIWIDFNLKPVKDEQGKVVLLVGEGVDISEQKQAANKVLDALDREKQLNDLQSTFVSMVTHQFRTPLSVIRTSAELIQNYSEYVKRSKRKQYFEKICAAVGQMDGLLSEVLNLNRVEVGALQCNPTRLDLKQFCQDLIMSVQMSVGTLHTIVFNWEGEPQELTLDPDLLKQVFTNLLSNAIKYSPEGGNVHVTLRYDVSTVDVEIRDEGIGIPYRDQRFIFTDFYRGNNVGTIRGAGLGLSIAKRCLDLQGGQINFHSQLGEGTTFTVRFPLERP